MTSAREGPQWHDRGWTGLCWLHSWTENARDEGSVSEFAASGQREPVGLARQKPVCLAE